MKIIASNDTQRTSSPVSQLLLTDEYLAGHGHYVSILSLKKTRYITEARTIASIIKQQVRVTGNGTRYEGRSHVIAFILGAFKVVSDLWKSNEKSFIQV